MFGISYMKRKFLESHRKDGDAGVQIRSYEHWNLMR